MPSLGSQLGTLSPHLIATIYPVVREKGGSGEFKWKRAEADQGGDTEVYFPATDGSMEMSMNWTSPFEAIGAEQKLPLLASLVQSGALGSLSSALLDLLPDDFGIGGFSTDQLKEFSANGIDALEGRSGITKLNSTQIFSGMQPLKFSVTAHFRAWADPVAEVERPLNQLAEWALPKKLSAAGFVETLTQERSLIRALFPSEIPTICGFQFGTGMTVLPVVIESMSQPFTVPRERDRPGLEGRKGGGRLSVAVQLQMTTLAAIDRNDYRNFAVR